MRNWLFLICAGEKIHGVCTLWIPYCNRNWSITRALSLHWPTLQQFLCLEFKSLLGVGGRIKDPHLLFLNSKLLPMSIALQIRWHQYWEPSVNKEVWREREERREGSRREWEWASWWQELEEWDAACAPWPLVTCKALCWALHMITYWIQL